MYRMNWWLAMALVAMAGLAALPAIAAGPAPTVQPSMTKPLATGCMFAQSSKVIGAGVQNNSGEKLGTIDNIVLTTDRQTVLYAVLSHGGTMGIHAKYFAVPWSALTVQAKGCKVDHLVLDITKAALDKAAGFDHKLWPVSADTTLFKVPWPPENPRAGS